MGKSREDEIYERNVKDGQKGGFGEDLIRGNIPAVTNDEKIAKAGYTYGAQHRYGSEGRFHTWGGKGSNDPKNETASESDESEPQEEEDSEESSFSNCGGGSSDFEDRHYTTRDSYTTQSKGISKLAKWAVGIGLVGALAIGLKNYANNHSNKKPQQKALTSKVYDDAIQNRDKRIKKSLDNWISNNLNYPPVRDLMGLKYPVKISLGDYSIVGENIWAACYRHGYGGKGHLIYSKDSGENWGVLWRDDRTSLNGIRFFNENTGFMATDGRVLKSTNGGRNWEGILYVKDIPTMAIKIIESIDAKNEENILLRLRGHLSESIETSNGGRTWGYFNYRSLKFITYDGGRSWEKSGKNR